MKRVVCIAISCAFAARGTELAAPPPGMNDVVVCRTPCGVPVEFGASDEFVLGGREIIQSEPFTLKLREDDATLHVSAGTQGSRIAGGILLAGSGALLLGGGFALAVSGGGLALGLLGAILLWAGGHPTSFTSEP